MRTVERVHKVGEVGNEGKVEGKGGNPGLLKARKGARKGLHGDGAGNALGLGPEFGGSWGPRGSAVVSKSRGLLRKPRG